MKKKNFTPKHKVAFSIVALFLLFFMTVPQQADAQCPLACNDDVTVSVDHNCEALITPEMVIEGENDNLQCNYLIKAIYDEFNNLIPPTNGVPGYYVLGSQHLYRTLTVQVGYDDPDNPNVCEGRIFLEDRLPPVLNCLEDVFLSCNEDLGDYLTSNTTALYPYDANKPIVPSVGPNYLTLPATIPDGGFLDIPVTVNNLANQSELLNRLQAVLSLSTTTNIQVEIIGPIEQSPNVLTSPFIDSYYNGFQMVDWYFNGEWTIRVTDLALNGSFVVVYDLDLKIESESFMTSQYSLVDNCEVDEIFVISDETEDLKDCGDWSAVRTIVFQGRDHVGLLSNTCTHTIYFERKTVADIVWPLNRDDYQLDALNCSNIPKWDSNGDGYPQPSESGLPTIEGIPVTPEGGYAGFCEIGLTYTDQVIDICPGTFKVLRLWTAVNCCGPTGYDNPITHYQIILVQDNEGPIVSACFPDIVVNANPFTCYTDVDLPGPFSDPSCPMIIYDCNVDLVTYKVAYKFGDCDNPPGPEVPWIYDTGIVQNPDGTYKLLKAPIGCTWIKYTFTDACGNSTDAFFEILVVDEIPPVAVCDEHTVVTVTGECSARVFAETFDDGSFDNCSPVRFEVRRMTGNCGGTNVFGSYVEFCAGDIGKTIQVVLKVIDEAGNFNTCMVDATINDKTPPYVVCPPDIKISCEQNYLDLEVTGEAEAFDNCGIQSLTFKDYGELNQCNVGVVYRTWTATDFGGRTHSCTQRIDIIDYQPFNKRDIKWPTDKLNLQGCINADTDPSNTGEPVLNDDFCSLVAFTYEDQVFTLVEGACYKILRTWTVLDWCQFDQSNPFTNGIWRYTQIIMVYNYDAPVFTSACNDVTICGFNADCTGDVDILATAEDECTPTDELVWEYRVDFYNDETIDRFGFTNNYVQNRVPLGTHRIYWTVEDLCGNLSTCSYLFKVTDCKKPTPLCISEITTVLMPNSGMVEINARDFDHGSYDNCTKGSTCDDCHSDLFYSFSENIYDDTKIFTIADIGLNTVQMWVTDEYGNQDYCEVSIMIQDNANLGGMVAGLVKTEENAGVEGVEMELEEVNAHESVFSQTNSEGYYQIQSGYENGDYKVRGSKEDNYSTGVSTLDLVMIQKHLLGILPLTSPYKLLAADADNNNSVSASDLFQLRKLILGVQAELANSDAWYFVDNNYLFSNPDNPWYAGDDEAMYSIELRNLDSDEMYNNFTAVKIGDVNGSVSDLINPQQIQNRNMLQLHILEQDFQADQQFAVPVFANNFDDMVGMQFTLGFDENMFDFVGIAPAALEIKPNNIGQVKNGQLNMSWNQATGITLTEDQALFTIELRAKTNGQLINQITINSNQLEAEAYSNDLEIKRIGLTIRSKENTGFVLYQNTPNPFKNETEIVFDLPANTFATLTVYDVTGKVLKSVSQEFAKGRNSVSMSKNDLKTTGGVLYYQLETENNTAVKKMIMLK